MIAIQKTVYFFGVTIFFQGALSSQEYSFSGPSWAVRVPLPDQKDSLKKTAVRKAAIKQLVQQIEMVMDRHERLQISYPDNFQRTTIEVFIAGPQGAGYISQLFSIYHVLSENIDTALYEAEELLEQAESESRNKREAVLEFAMPEKKDPCCCCVCQ